jgi:hypothetical protein
VERRNSHDEERLAGEIHGGGSGLRPCRGSSLGGEGLRRGGGEMSCAGGAAAAARAERGCGGGERRLLRWAQAVSAGAAAAAAERGCGGGAGGGRVRISPSRSVSAARVRVWNPSYAHVGPMCSNGAALHSRQRRPSLLPMQVHFVVVRSEQFCCVRSNLRTMPLRPQM